ncbi:hypothetical protein BJX63DRAFT_387229 [Aspergillus granulosus]|uniref:Lysine-specific metallo-endopeptidase domain-containing protein n=1 Tax=Aspergillus granulosus TaxID=176169 RepID=A0ABR4HMQ3_9EURO
MEKQVPLFKDNRSRDGGGQQNIDFPPSRCGNQHQKCFAFTASDVPIGLDLTVYCPQHSISWRFNRLADLAKSAIPSIYHFDMISYHYIGLSIMHELMHSRNILGGDAIGDADADIISCLKNRASVNFSSCCPSPLQALLLRDS